MFRFQFVVVLAVLTVPLAAADKDVAKNDSPKPATSRKIGVLDVNRLFKKHAELKRKLRDLQAEATLVQAKYESELKTLQKKSEELKGLTAGSREYQNLEEDLVKEKARIQAEIPLKRKDFVQREARLYLEVYQEIKKDVAKIAKSQRLTLVLNANLDEINRDNPEEVARGISNKVVWFDDSIDLTPQLEGNYANSTIPAAKDKRPSIVAESNGHGNRPAPAELPAILPRAASGLPAISTR